MKLLLPSTAIGSGSRMPGISEKELFVAIVYNESHFVSQSLSLDDSRSIDPFLVKYYFIITIYR